MTTPKATTVRLPPLCPPTPILTSLLVEHQRLQKQKDQSDKDQWYNRGARAGPAATKYRKGACENCGSLMHKTKECLSRPRKLGARWSGRDIQADEVIQKVELGWDGKRDRWNGYDPREHDEVVKEHQRLEELRRLEKEREMLASEAKKETDREGGEDSAEENNEDKYAEESGMPGQTFDAANRISTRNLRIREDTAKYLLNLDLNSARYDPKTRTMVNNTDVDPNNALHQRRKSAAARLELIFHRRGGKTVPPNQTFDHHSKRPAIMCSLSK